MKTNSGRLLSWIVLGLIVFMSHVTHAQIRKSIVDQRRRQIAEDLIRGDQSDSLYRQSQSMLQIKDSVITALNKKDERKQEIIVEMAGQLLESENLMDKIGELAEEEVTAYKQATDGTIEKLTRQRNGLGALGLILTILLVLALL